MAKIAEIQQPNPTNLIIITSLAVLGGLLVHFQALHSSSIPGSDLPYLKTQSTAALIKSLGISSSEQGIQYSIPSQLAILFGDNELSRFFWIIVCFFKAMLTRPLGKGLLVLLLTFAAPILMASLLETFRPKRSRWLGALMVFAFTTVGQAVCIGTASNVIYVPAVAFARWEEATKDPMVRPSASPSHGLVQFALGLNLVAGATIFWTCFCPTTSDWWVLSNLAFQFFPVAFLPLLLIPTPSKFSTSTSPRLAAARGYQILSYSMIPAYYLSIYMAWPQIYPALVKGGANPFSFVRHLFSDLNDGEHLLLWDGLGLLIAAYALILIEAEADEASIRTGFRPVHAKRSLLEDMMIGWVGLLVLGPGFGVATFFGRREIVAEKARWGVVKKD